MQRIAHLFISPLSLDDVAHFGAPIALDDAHDALLARCMVRATVAFAPLIDDGRLDDVDIAYAGRGEPSSVGSIQGVSHDEAEALREYLADAWRDLVNDVYAEGDWARDAALATATMPI